MPVEENLTADITLLGMVRHVFRRGRIGTFAKVPEAENDDVYEEVVLKRIPHVRLWNFSGDPVVYQDVARTQTCTIAVATNRDDATFVASDTTGKLLGKGTGKDASITFPAEAGGHCNGTMHFMPIVVDRQKGSLEVLGATLLVGTNTSIVPTEGTSSMSFAFDSKASLSVIASYKPLKPKK